MPRVMTEASSQLRVPLRSNTPNKRTIDTNGTQNDANGNQINVNEWQTER